MYILKGTEGPEKFITWQISVQSKIINSKEITKIPHWYNIFNNILKCTTGSTKIFVREIISEFLNPDNVIKESNGELFLQQIKHGNIQEFRNLKVLSVLNAHDNQDALDLFVTLLDFYKLVVDELFFRLGEIFFGTDMVGVNACYLLRCLIRDYKVNSNQGIKEWSDRFKQLQTYIPFVPSKVLDPLSNALPKNYCK